MITVGKLGLVDSFDNNKHAHDPPAGFMNSTIIDTGAFGCAAKARAYTVGGAVERHAGPWTLRGGSFDISIAPNTTTPHSRFGHPSGAARSRGAIRSSASWARSRSADCCPAPEWEVSRNAILLAAATGGPADIAAVRQQGRHQHEPGAIDRQECRPVHARRLEPYAFTDLNRSVAAGRSLSGKMGGRKDDTLAIAGVVNQISAIHQPPLDAGGLAILVGDAAASRTMTLSWRPIRACPASSRR